MSDEMVYISPCEAEFMSLNLLMLYFESGPSFQTSLLNMEKGHPEIMNSEHLEKVLGIVSMVGKKNYAQYIRTMTETKDILLGHVMSMPQILTGIRIKYFNQLKTLNYSSSLESSTMEMEHARQASLSDFQKRLGIDSQEEITYFLSFMYGKKNRGVELYSTDRNIINLEHYQADTDDLLSKVGKIKMNRPVMSLMDKLTATSQFNKREMNMKGPKKDLANYSEHVHQNISLKVRSTMVYMEAEDEPEASYESEEEVEEYHEPEVKQVSPSPASNQLRNQSSAQVDQQAKKSNPREDKRKSAEMCFRLMKIKIRSLKKQVMTSWSIYSIAKNAEHLEILTEFIESRNEQIRFQCFDEWRLQIRNRKMMLEEIMAIPDYEGNIDEIDGTPLLGLILIPEYNYKQTFILGIFRHLLRKWFEVLVPQQILCHNLSHVRNFELSWLFIIDGQSDDAIYFSSYLSQFLLTEEECEQVIVEGREMQTEYYVDNWIDRAGVTHSGRLTFILNLRTVRPSDITKADILNSDFQILFNSDRRLERQIEAKFDEWAEEIESAAEARQYTSDSAYFKQFSDLIREGRKNLIKLRPRIEDMTIDFEIDSLNINGVLWHYFNLELNYGCLQSFLSVCLHRVSEMIGWIDDIYFSGQTNTLKVLDMSKPFVVEDLLRHFHNSLQEIEARRTLILTEDGLFMDEDSEHYMRTLLQQNYKSFFFTRNLFTNMLTEMIEQSSRLSGDDKTTVELLKNIHSAILDPIMKQDFYLATSKNYLIYEYISKIMAACSPRWQQLFDTDITKLLWSKVISLVKFDNSTLFSADWLKFFIYLLECIVETLRLSKRKDKVKLVDEFESTMLMDTKFRLLAKQSDNDYNKCLSTQTWSPEKISKNTEEIAKMNHDRIMSFEHALNDDVTVMTQTPSCTESEDDSILLGKRKDHVHFCFNALEYEYIDRLLKL